MTRSNLDPAVRVSRLIVQLRHEHDLSQERVAGLLGEHPATVASWATGHTNVPEAVLGTIEQLAVRLNFGSLKRWKERVTRSFGLEVLIARDLTVLAVSDEALLTKDAHARAASVPREYFIGRNANDLLPSLDCNLILRHGAGLADLDAVGLFDGRVRCVRYSAELHYSKTSRSGIYEFWPVETVDAGIVAHHICHPYQHQRETPQSVGVVVHWSEIVPL